MIQGSDFTLPQREDKDCSCTFFVFGEVILLDGLKSLIELLDETEELLGWVFLLLLGLSIGHKDERVQVMEVKRKKRKRRSERNNGDFEERSNNERDPDSRKHQKGQRKEEKEDLVSGRNTLIKDRQGKVSTWKCHAGSLTFCEGG